MVNKSFLFIALFFPIIASNNLKKLNITVLIHGSIRPRTKLSDLRAIKNDKNVACTDYAKTNDYLREHPFTRQSQPMQDRGLHRIKSDSPESSRLSKAIISELDNKKDELMYTFGWSGLLSRSERKKEGCLLYNQLEKEVENFKKQGIDPKVRIIAFSHGGNIALHMASGCGCKPSFVVNDLILIGTPVQRDTDYLINNKLFAAVYNFYSTVDVAQGLDHISASTHYCHQRFMSRKGFCLPKKLKQIRLRVRKAIKRKKCPAKVCVLPTEKFEYIDPDHIELWFYGWCARGYRKDFPLYPLPIFIFTPWLVKVINHLPTNYEHITADIYPQAGVVDLNFGKFCKTKESFSVPFLDCNDLEELKNWTHNKKPSCGNIEEIYRKVIHDALAVGIHRRRCRDKECTR